MRGNCMKKMINRKAHDDYDDDAKNDERQR